MTMKIEVNGNTIELEEHGAIKTIINEGGKGNIETGSWPRIIDEFYPLCGKTVQTQVDSLIIHPHTFKRRTLNYRCPKYLKRERLEKNRTIQSIADDFNTNESTVRPYIGKYNIDKPLENKEYLEELWEECESIEEIANEIGEETYKVKIALEQNKIVGPYASY